MLVKTYERVSDKLVSLGSDNTVKGCRFVDGVLIKFTHSKHRQRQACVYRKFWRMKNAYT